MVDAPAVQILFPKATSTTPGPPGPIGPAGLSGDGGKVVPSRATLAASATSAGAYALIEGGRDGTFEWIAGDFSAQVASDPYQGIYVASASDPTGLTGAWVRSYSGAIQFAWFGVADGVANNAERCESALALLGARGATFEFAAGKIATNREIRVTTTPDRIVGAGPSSYSSISDGATVLEAPPGQNGISFLNTGGIAGAQRASLENIVVYQPVSLNTTATASHTAGTSTITVTGGTNDYEAGQCILLEGAGTSVVVPGRRIATTAGSNIANITNVGAVGDATVYTGQPISIAGAGLPEGTFVQSWTSNQIILSANAANTVSNAEYTVAFPLASRIASVVGNTITLTQLPTNSQTIVGGRLRHAPAAIYSAVTLDTNRVNTAGFEIGLFLHGEGPGQAIADNGTFNSSIFGGIFAGVLAQGFDAQANSFFGCNLAGPKIGFLDLSLIGNNIFGAHFAFNIAIACPLPSTTSTLFGCYIEQGTAILGNGQCTAFGCNTIANGSGWQVWGQYQGGVNMPSPAIVAGGSVAIGGVSVLRDQQPAIASHPSDATVNAILAAMRAHGMIAS